MNLSVFILGLGISGRAAAAFLLKRGHRVIAADKKADKLFTQPEVVSLLSLGLDLRKEEWPQEKISLMVLSPGISNEHPLVQKALKENVEIIGEAELAFRHISNRCIGITGTNGKTTTVLLVAHLLNKAGIKAKALGNVGVGLSSYLLNPDPEEILVVELSSFQLMSLQSRCLDLAVILNLTPNHLDWHADMNEYVFAKLSIQTRLKSKGRLLVSQEIAKKYESFLINDRLIILGESSQVPLALISSVEYIKLGVPERENVQAAFAIAKEFGLKPCELEEGLKSFCKPPHRIEWVAEICGVSYYNDSKSSNVDSVIHAVKQFLGGIVIIVGGKDKGSSYRPWIESFKGKVKRIIAYGAAAPKLEEELSKEFPFEKRELFRDAVLCACKVAEARDIVLLSPGCSSYDQFCSYEQRGDEFKRIVDEFAVLQGC